VPFSPINPPDTAGVFASRRPGWPIEEAWVREDELRSAEPAALLGTRRRFLTITGAAVALAFTTRLPGVGTAAASGPPPADPFTLGLASGDPLPDAVVLWTRLAPDPFDPFGGMPERMVPVQWQVAADERFSRVVRSGIAMARPEYGHAVHVDVRGLQPGRQYHYRFRSGRHLSPVGRTKTAPSASSAPSSLRFAVVSCQMWNDGHFTAYRHLAAEDLDLVVHLGDYLYEYGVSPDGGHRGVPLPAEFARETDTLDRYRLQHALYKTDPDLQAAHAALPFLATWDDHEVDNDYADEVPEVPAMGGTTEDFLVRRANAYRAYWEHMPLRAVAEPVGPDMQLYRRLSFGDLAAFNVLDTRQYRSDQAWSDGIDGDRFAPGRTMLGDEQERWLLDGLTRSQARWNVLAQQVKMGRLDQDPGPAEDLSMEAWDGYPASRQRILDVVAGDRVRNPVVLVGDVHRNYGSGTHRRRRGSGLTDDRGGVHRHVDQLRRGRRGPAVMAAGAPRREPVPAVRQQPARLPPLHGDPGPVAHGLPGPAVRQRPGRADLDPRDLRRQRRRSHPAPRVATHRREGTR
jgi:alkaline phosphatase D